MAVPRSVKQEDPRYLQKRITYYCNVRKKLFHRLVLCDNTPEILTKLEVAEFASLGDGHGGTGYSLIVKKVMGHYYAINQGDSGSVPAYLFGPDYYRARRVDSNATWDFRKEAFSPAPGAADLLARRLK